MINSFLLKAARPLIPLALLLLLAPAYALDGDVNSDCKVNIIDLAAVGMAFGSSPGDANWNPDADLNNDSSVNILDLATVGSNFGNECNINCSTNSDCGTDGFGDPYCYEGDVYQDYRTFTCNDPGTPESSCSQDDVPTEIEVCTSGCSGGVCQSGGPTTFSYIYYEDYDSGDGGGKKTSSDPTGCTRRGTTGSPNHPDYVGPASCGFGIIDDSAASDDRYYFYALDAADDYDKTHGPANSSCLVTDVKLDSMTCWDEGTNTSWCSVDAYDLNTSRAKVYVSIQDASLDDWQVNVTVECT